MRFHEIDRRLQGRHPASAGSLALCHGSCLLPLKLRLSLQTGECRFRPRPRSELFAHSGVTVRFRISSFPPGSLRGCLSSLRIPAAKPEPSGGIDNAFVTAKDNPLTLAHSSNYRCLHRTVFTHTTSKPWWRSVTRLAVGFRHPHHFFVVSRRAAARRLAP
jgi:hypothetical protein